LFPNAGEFDIPVAITSMLPEAVAEARAYMSARRRAFEQDMQNRLQQGMSSLADLEGRQLSFLECEYPEDQTLIGTRLNKKLERKRHIDAVFADYRRWMGDTMTTTDSPFLRIAAVFLG
jgi:hypothetical protein